MPGSSAAQTQQRRADSRSMRTLGPLTVMPARGWEGTHVGALNDDVLEEVLKRLPPRALAMAGMVSASSLCSVLLFTLLFVAPSCVMARGSADCCGAL